MPAIIVNGTTYAVGLEWVNLTDPQAVARRAARSGHKLYALRAGQSGLATGSQDHAEGQPSLAAALCAYIPQSTWVALVEGAADTYALIRVNNNTILSRGDQILHQRADAISEFTRLRGEGWAGVFATPGLAADVGELELSGMAPAEGASLRPIPAPKVTVRRVAKLAAAAAAAIPLAAAAAYHEAILDLIAGEDDAVSQIIAPEPTVTVEVDGAALARHCRDAIRAHPHPLPSWRTTSVQCHARFSQSEIVAKAPALGGQPALLMQWTLDGEFNASIQRESAISQLSSWGLAQVSGLTAWAVAELPPVLRLASPPPPPLAWRREVDRALGPRVERMQYTTAPGTGAVTIQTSKPLTDIATMVDHVPGLEVIRLVRARSGWQVDGRLSRPVTIKKSQFQKPRRPE